MEINRGGAVYLVEVPYFADFRTCNVGLFKYRGRRIMFEGVIPVVQATYPSSSYDT